MLEELQGKSALPLHDLWTEHWRVPLCKSAMSRNRFCEILLFLRFDVKSNRSHRLQTDNFALLSEVWAHFTDNCCALYKPEPFITVDEQLFPSKARCPFTQYMTSKPDKFGQKYRLAVDKESKYVINGFQVQVILFCRNHNNKHKNIKLREKISVKLLRQGGCEGTVRSSSQQPPYCHDSDISNLIATERTVSIH